MGRDDLYGGTTRATYEVGTLAPQEEKGHHDLHDVVEPLPFLLSYRCR